MNAYVLHVRCSNCDRIFRENGPDADFYNAFRHKVCPQCGEHGFYDVVERWVRTSVWWQPWTWKRGYWEGKP